MNSARCSVLRAFLFGAAALGILCGTALLALEPPAGRPSDREVREGLELMLRTHYPRGTKRPSAVEQLRAYSKASGVPLEEILSVLKAFVEEGRNLRGDDDAARMQYGLSANALGWLAEAEGRDALALVKEIALGAAEGELARDLRRGAISLAIGLGGEDLAEFVRTVCGDRNLNNVDRLMLYRDLSPYAGVNSWGRAPARSPDGSPDQTTLRGDICRFLLAAVTRESATDCVRFLDQTLSVASRFYARSNGRLDVLRRLSKDGIAMHEQYAGKELTVLEKVRPEDRTRIPGEIADPAQLEGLGRAVLYAPTGYVELDRLLTYEAMGESVQRFQDLLVAAALRDPAPDNVIRIDTMLCAAGGPYKTSYEREKALARFEGSDVPRRKEYLAKELASLRQTPAAQRTHVAVAAVPRRLPWEVIGLAALAAVFAIGVGLLNRRARKRRAGNPSGGSVPTV